MTLKDLSIASIFVVLNYRHSVERKHHLSWCIKRIPFSRVIFKRNRRGEPVVRSVTVNHQHRVIFEQTETFRDAAGGDVLFRVYQPVDVCVGPGAGV